MEIRPLAAADLAPLLDLYRHLHDTDDPLPEWATVAELWSDIVADPQLRYFGAWIDEQLVSSCTLAIIPNLTRGCRPYAVIENVVTHALFRRRGYGKAVLAAAVAHAWQAGCYKAMLMTGRKDGGTRDFYRAAGFDPDAKQAFVAKPGRDA